MVDFSTPLDVRLERDFDPFLPHGAGADFKDFGVEGMKHVDAKVIPIFTALVTRR